MGILFTTVIGKVWSQLRQRNSLHETDNITPILIIRPHITKNNIVTLITAGSGKTLHETDNITPILINRTHINKNDIVTDYR